MTLTDTTWTRDGITLLWDPLALSLVCASDQVVSIRRFLTLDRLNWPDDETPLVDDQRLVVAGIESALDSLAPEAAAEWASAVLQPAILRYQSTVAQGGRQAALILWLAEQRRLAERLADESWHWQCTGEHRGEQLPLGHCLFGGTQRELRPIPARDQRGGSITIGLYHPRIS